MARKLGTNSIAHGCTAAGNDQVRFEVAHAHARAGARGDRAGARQGVQAPGRAGLPDGAQPAGAAVRRRVFDQSRPLGRDDWRQGDADLRRQHSRLAPGCCRRTRSRIRARRRSTPFDFEKGRPVGLDGKTMSAVEVVEQLETLGAPYGIGRGIHLGDTIIGTKGRVAFEAPAAETLLTAHRELEKLVLTPRQQRIKESLAGPYGDWVHEGQLLDPVCRDIEALLLSSQERVTGKVHVLFRPGSLFIEGVESPYSLMAVSKGVYGESAWRVDAAGCARFFEDRFAHGHVPCACGRQSDGTPNENCSRRQDCVGHPGLRPRQRGARRHRQHSRRGRRGRGRGDPHQQVHLQHARAHQRPHGQGRQGRHRRGRARPSQGAVRLLGPRAREREARRHHPDAQHRRRARRGATR